MEHQWQRFSSFVTDTIGGHKDFLQATRSGPAVTGAQTSEHSVHTSKLHVSAAPAMQQSGGATLLFRPTTRASEAKGASAGMCRCYCVVPVTMETLHVQSHKSDLASVLSISLGRFHAWPIKHTMQAASTACCTTAKRLSLGILSLSRSYRYENVCATCTVKADAIAQMRCGPSSAVRANTPQA